MVVNFQHVVGTTLSLEGNNNPNIHCIGSTLVGTTLSLEGNNNLLFDKGAIKIVGTALSLEGNNSENDLRQKAVLFDKG